MAHMLVCTTAGLHTQPQQAPHLPHAGGCHREWEPARVQALVQDDERRRCHHPQPCRHDRRQQPQRTSAQARAALVLAVEAILLSGRAKGPAHGCCGWCGRSRVGKALQLLFLLLLAAKVADVGSGVRAARVLEPPLVLLLLLLLLL